LIEGSGAAASRRAIVAAGLGMPGFASPPDQFPDLVATARLRRSATSSPSRKAHPIRGASPTSSIASGRARRRTALVARFYYHAFHDAMLALESVPLPMIDQRADRFIADGGKGPYPLA
jgi:hypothetical protein